MNEFDVWREKYDSMSLEEQVEYHNDLELRYPSQAHFTYPIVEEALNLIDSLNINVLEFGSWKADMAQRALTQFPNIKQWTGIEICKNAIEKTKCFDDRFDYIFPSKFNWFEDERKIYADIIFATHFIEHLSNSHFEQLVKYVKGAKHVYFECPITDGGQTWLGDVSTHKLEYGWNDVIRLMGEQGYKVYKKYPEGVIFELI